MRSLTFNLCSAAAALLFATTAMVGPAGCTTGRAERIETNDPGLALQATTTRLYAGETTTVTTQTQNLLGRESNLKWATTGGELTTEDGGRIARVKFDRAGQYVISAQLYVDGELTESDTVTVTVLPLR